MFNIFIFCNILHIILSIPLCKEGTNNCSKCNLISNLCIRCNKDYFIPDLNGGCEYSKKCQPGKNNCMVCLEERNLCQKCEDNYFPDEIGGCSYTDNCEVSKYGKCLKCKSNYILIGIDDYYNEGIKICKSLNAEDLQNCESINMNNGQCFFCKKGFHLNSGDKKCIETENCYESSNGKCIKCSNGYYLDKIDNKCKKQKANFIHCKETFNGEKCSLCDNFYYLAEDGNCIYINFCKSVENNSRQCKECISGFYLTGDGYACTPEKNCLRGDTNFGICHLCKDNYYLDNIDRKCKPNQKENDLKYCEVADGDKCKKCIIGYAIGEDNKCSNSYDCKRSINNTCIECIDNYHLTLNNFCTNVEKCIYGSFYIVGCVQCEDHYYYDEYNMECKLEYGNFINCQSSEFLDYCEKCRDNYYINLTDNLCYKNNNEQDKFYKCAKVNITEDENPIYKCLYCIDNYYLGLIDNKCTTIEGCDLSENENKCLKCDGLYCLDMKTNKCIPNDEIIDENKNFYYGCERTNKEGTACEICIDGYLFDENNLCIDELDYIERKTNI